MLTIYDDVLADDIGQQFLACSVEPENKSSRGQLFHALALEAELSPERLVGNAWQNHLLERILHDENAFSLKAQRGGIERMGSGLIEAARTDLAELRRLFDEDLGLGELLPAGEREPKPFKLELAGAKDWPAMAGALARYYAEYG
ncbi:MAG: hypothetical protein ACHQ7M_06185, partial [Chloroflexota bacterium]